MPLLVCMVLLLYDEELREREGERKRGRKDRRERGREGEREGEREGGKESEREMVIVNLLITNNNSN